MANTLAWRSLVRRKDFQRVYESGVKNVGRLLVVYLLCADDMARAVVASKKVGNAVKRNRAKRLLREAFRRGTLGQPQDVMGLRQRLAPTAEGRPSAEDVDEGRESKDEGKINGLKTNGLWVVLVARRRILAASSREVRSELDDLLADMPGVEPGPHPG